MTSVPTNADFIAQFPEFTSAPAALVTSALAKAARRTNADVYQTAELAADACMLKAATLLLRSPFGLKLRQANPNQKFTWEFELRDMQRSATIGLRCF